MPEGPEIRRAADRLQSILVDRELQRVEFAFEQLKHYEDELRASRVDRVDTRGKAMLIHFRSGKVIYSHNQLYGRWYLRKRGKPPATRRQLRLALETETDAALLFSASDITVLDDHALEEHPFLAKAGPDLLTDRPSARQIADRLEGDRFRRRGLGALLLDQSFVAGLGNYLRSEVLFVSGIHPLKRGQDLERKQRIRLARAIRDLTQRSYQTGGITNEPKRAARLKRRGVRRRLYRHYVFGRAAEPCFDCGTTIIRETVAGRRLYRCPTCQPGE
jgi:endonuclease-8